MQMVAESHTERYEAKPRSLVTCSACGYGYPRGGVTCPRCGQPGPESRTVRTARKRRKLSKCIMGALIIMLAGGVIFVHAIPFPMNLVAGAMALLLGAATASDWECGRCHAKTDRYAVECPRCGLPFSA